jgi:hypothetical protein
MTDPEPLDSDIRSMLEASLPMAAVPDAARARILSRVEARIALLPPGGGGQGPGQTAAPRANVPGPSGASSWVASHPWLAVSAAFVLGTVAGFGVRGEPPPTRVVYVDRRPVEEPPAPEVAPPVPTSPQETVPVEALPAVPSSAPGESAKASPGSASGPEVNTGDRLAAESAVLDVARTALAEGDGERALDAVGRHEATFVHGLLTEEREALGIRALLALGRTKEAESRFARFRARYPESLFLPAVESAMKKAP